jgi:hypothetical protein
MRRSLHDPVGLVAIAALESLTAFDPESAYPCLLEALAHEDEEVVSAALQQLSAGGRTDWLAGVTERLLNHRHWEVRSTFIRVLATQAGRDCRELLEGRLLVEGEEPVRQLLQELLAGFPAVQG